MSSKRELRYTRKYYIHILEFGVVKRMLTSNVNGDELGCPETVSV